MGGVSANTEERSADGGVSTAFAAAARNSTVMSTHRPRGGASRIEIVNGLAKVIRWRGFQFRLRLPSYERIPQFVLTQAVLWPEDSSRVRRGRSTDRGKAGKVRCKPAQLRAPARKPCEAGKSCSVPRRQT